MNTPLIVLRISLLFLQPATDVNVRLQDVVAGLERREAAFFDSESLMLKYAWGMTDHLTLSPDEEKDLQDLERKRDFAEILARYHPRQSIMRTSGDRREFAIRGEMLFMRLTNPLNERYGKLGRTAAFDGRFGVDLEQKFHALLEAAPSPDTWQDFDYAFAMLLDIYSRVSGLDVMRDLPPAKRTLCLPADMKERASLYRISGSEQIDGEHAVLIERQDTHRIWVAPVLGFAIRRVDIFLEGSDFSEDARVSSHLMSDFRKAKDDLWLPWIITEELFVASPKRSGPAAASHKDASVSSRLQLRRTLAVESAEFDTLKPEFFQLPLPAGIMVHDHLNNITYVNQKEGIPFTDAIESGKANTATQSQFSLKTILLLLGNMGVVLVLVLYFLSRRKLR